MFMRKRLSQAHMSTVGRVSDSPLPLWLVFLMPVVWLGSWSLPQAWGQETTGGMKLLLQELREVKRANLDAVAQIEELRRQLRSLASGSPSSVSYRLPARIEFCSEPVPLGRRDVWERLDYEFLLSISRPGQVMLWLKRMGRYMPVIEQRLKDYGLPDDLKYLPIVESSLRPTAVSSAGAGGLWQFIEATGRHYDMESNPWVDERMDVGKATEGAMQYLRRLYGIFQNWPLALAAYNAGEQRVLDELRDQGVSSYYELALPAETERFVYKIIAMKVILANAERYGILVDQEEYYQPPETESVTVRVSGTRMHLRAVAEAAGTYYAMVKHLNPQLRQRYLPRGVHQVYVPRGTAATFAQNFRELPDSEPFFASQTVDPKPTPRPEATASRKTIHYEVKKGDTLTKIAAKFDASVESLKRWNKIGTAAQITPGRQLVIVRD